MLKNFNKFSVILLPIFIILNLYICVNRYLILTGKPFLSGADAYYYALQIKFFVKTGILKIPDSAPLMQLMGLTGKLGISPEQTIVLWTILIQVLCAVSILMAYKLVHGKNNGYFIPALLFSWVLLSPTLSFTCIEFPKFAFSLIFLPFWPVALIKKRYWPVSLIAIFFSCISHLTMIGLLVLLSFGLILYGFLRLRFHRFIFRKWYFITGFSLFILLILLMGNKFFLISDLKRIQFEGLQPSWWTFFYRSQIPVSLKLELVISFIVGIFLLLFIKKAPHRGIIGFWSPIVIFLLILPLGSKEIMGIPERLSLILPFITICSMIGFQKSDNYSLKACCCLTISLASILVILFPKIYLALVHPEHLNPDYAIYDRVTNAIAGKNIPMLIAHQGLNYFYKYKTMNESFPYEPEAHWPKQKIWRVVYGVTPSEWSYYLPEKHLWGSGMLYSLPGRYSLIREDAWNEFRTKVKISADDEFKELVLHSWLNPSQKRPEFSRKRAERDKDGDFSAYPK